MTNPERQILEARKKSGKTLDLELRRVERMVDPLPSFLRGIQVGAFFITAFNLFAPAAFGMPSWPQPVRLVLGIVCLSLVGHFLVRQRGFMLAQRINRGVRP